MLPILTLILFLVLPFYKAFILLKFYAWFVMPLFPMMPIIGLVQMIGLGMFINLITFAPSEFKERINEDKNEAFKAAWMMYLCYSAILGFGYLFTFLL